MTDTITGYQYSPVDAKFVGEYAFPNNLDKEDIHLPPFTTLEQPPAVSGNQAAYWRHGEWCVDVVAEAAPISAFSPPEIDDYSRLMPSFIAWMKSTGNWSPEHQQKLDAALAALPVIGTQEELDVLFAQENGGNGT